MILRKFTFFAVLSVLLFVGFQQTIFAQRPNYPFVQNPDCVSPCTTTPQTPPAPPDQNTYRPPVNGVAPAVTTGATVEIGTNSATMTGYVNPNGTPTTAWFEYSTSDLVSRSTGVTPIAGTPNSFARYVSGLKSNTTYYYKICAQNAGGLNCGSVLSFRTNRAASTNTATKTVIQKETVVVDDGTVKGVQASRTGVTQSTWGTIVRSLLFLLIIIIALAMAIRIFHSGH